MLRYAIVTFLVARFPSLAARLQRVFGHDAILWRLAPLTFPNSARDVFQDARDHPLPPAASIAGPSPLRFEPTTRGHRPVASMERAFEHWPRAPGFAASCWDSAIGRTARGKTGARR